ncbi:MAG: SEL1-like repeat protein [Parachlamydiaceae bacterium]|nr:MAG: SEL1-like repeat protein [Parachlamydiaceae bacterium]
MHAKERNYEKALECYEKADKHPEALYELSKLYRKGKGTDKDENRGIVLLSQSAKIGDQAHAHKCHKN